MRLLFVFLLTGFHLASLAGNVTPVVSEEQYVNIIEQRDASQINESTSFVKLTAHLTHCHYLKSNCQHRQLPFARFTNNIVSAKNAIIEIPNNLFVSHDCYCKPIRLLLLFPKHYFW
ncbi:MAG: hypothetical protein ABIN89_02570 [Chitinophagaceae bacterium]